MFSCRCRSAVALAGALCALALPAAAHAATLQVGVDDPEGGTPSAPNATGLDVTFTAGDPESDDPFAVTAPLGALSFEFGPSWRLGAPSTAPACSPDQVAADESACPDGSQVANGNVNLVLPPQPGDDSPQVEALDLSGYTAPGGRALSLLATGDYPVTVRTVIPATVDASGSTLLLTFPPALAPPAQLSSLSLSLGSDQAWSSTTGCPGSWPMSATATGPGPAATATTSVECDQPPPVADDSPGPLPVLKGGRHGRGGLCGRPKRGVHCGLGYGRRTSGGNGKVSHRGWPAITGVLWIADNHGRSGTGSRLNDEMLGGHGNDRLSGGRGNDILWGDQHPTGNTPNQSDVLDGGAGNDFLYTSHGANTVRGGTGNDLVYAYYGHGTIDCGPGVDTVWLRRLHPTYRVSGCERRRYF